MRQWLARSAEGHSLARPFPTDNGHIHPIGQDDGIDDFSARNASPGRKEHLAAFIEIIHKTILDHQPPTTLAKHGTFSFPLFLGSWSFCFRGPAFT
jgi:hypothetical protein